MDYARDMVPGTMELSLVVGRMEFWPFIVRPERSEGSRTSMHGTRSAMNRVRDGGGHQFPGCGNRLLDPRSNAGAYRTLCYPRASCMEEHWNGPFPYDDGPVRVYAPQYTHPHPRFSPDGQKVLYTSDCTGYAQIYVIDLTESLNI